MSSTPSTRFRFGLFEFNAATGELRREGSLVRLQPQPALLLAYLLDHAPELVSRDDLRSAIWGDATFVDFDRGLNFCISQVRAALRDDASGPRFIRTVPKQGYQFIGPVERVDHGFILAETTQFPKKKPSASKLALAFAALLLVGSVAFAAYWVNQSRKTHSPIVAVVRFDNETGDAALSRLSDGVADDLIVQLTAEAAGRFGVIGNAQILRLPREQRDLNAIATLLHSNYIILGQLQSNGSDKRLLAHLIHMPEQTHVWVVRMDGINPDPLKFQAEAAEKISQAFSPHIANGDTKPYHPSTKR